MAKIHKLHSKLTIHNDIRRWDISHKIQVVHISAKVKDPVSKNGQKMGSKHEIISFPQKPRLTFAQLRALLENNFYFQAVLVLACVPSTRIYLVV